MIRRISIRKVLGSFQRIIASRHFLTIIAFTIGFNSCYNDPALIGNNLVPDGDKTSVKLDTSFAVSAYTIETDTIPTNGYATATLGVINSSVFGRVKADFVSQFWIFNTKDSIYRMLPRLIVADSSFLTLKLKKVYGTKNQAINVKAYELSHALSIDSSYNGLANVDWRHSSLLVGETAYSGDTLLKIKLSNAFAQKLLDSDSAKFCSDTSFIRYMKGLYITCDDLTGSEKVIYHFYQGAELSLRYTFTYNGVIHDTTFKYINYYSPKFNHYKHDPSTANPGLRINNQIKISQLSTATQDSVFYIQGMGGVRGLIRFDGVPAWAAKMPIAINRAELRFDVQDHPVFPADSILNPLHFYSYRFFNNSLSSTTNDVVGIFDSQIGSNETTYYNKAKKYYSIDVTLHLQNLLRGKTSKNYVFLEPTDFKSGYKEGLFRSGNNSKPIKLFITYSKL